MAPLLMLVITFEKAQFFNKVVIAEQIVRDYLSPRKGKVSYLSQSSFTPSQTVSVVRDVI